MPELLRATSLRAPIMAILFGIMLLSISTLWMLWRNRQRLDQIRTATARMQRQVEHVHQDVESIRALKHLRSTP